MNQPINQSTNQPINQSTNQLINQSTNQLINQSTNQPIKMTEEKQTSNLIVKLTFEFALAIIDYTENLQNDKKFVMAKQLMKSGTSIGANTREAQNAESKLDFIHKFKIAAKEADETQYWLELCKHSKHYPSPENLLNQLDSILKILNKIIASSKRKSPLLFLLASLFFSYRIKPINQLANQLIS